jgi:hypothetical protein
MKMINSVAGFIVALFLLIGCASSKPVPDSSGVDTSGSLQTAKSMVDKLDHAMREISDYLNKRIPAGSKAVFLNVKSDWPDLSEYILSNLSENAVNDDVFTVVDRQQLDAIRSELNFQMSGEVSDASAQEIGKLLGAQSIISGSITTIGSIYRIQIRATEVQTAAVQGQLSQNVESIGSIVTSLTKKVVPADSSSSVTAIGSQTSARTQTVQTPATSPATSVVSQSTAPAALQNASQNQTQPDTPPSQPRISTDSAGLYVNGVYQGQMDLLDSIDWIKLNARSGGNYVIVFGKDEAVPYIMLNFNNLQLSITLKASGAERKIRYDNNRPSYSLFVVGTGVTFILEDGITLSGLQDNSKPLVRVEGGNFTMNGGSIKDNKHSNDGGGVYIDSGTFTMNNGTISGNYGYKGGGVYLNKGAFTMNNGTISRNSGYNGGGVCVESGIFSMLGGTISGNSARNYGGGVFCYAWGTFTKSGNGGIIYGSNAPEEQANRAVRDGHAVYGGPRNSTARVSQALDSRQKGATGGWE